MTYTARNGIGWYYIIGDVKVLLEARQRPHRKCPKFWTVGRVAPCLRVEMRSMDQADGTHSRLFAVLHSAAWISQKAV